MTGVQTCALPICALEENPDKKIFLLSQMIHNPEVNKDLLLRGVRFLQDTEGNSLLPLSEVQCGDIVIIPAFGATLAMEEQLNKQGAEIKKYNTTCPFVERVWKKSEQLGSGNYTIIIHGKVRHEETRATFSRSYVHGPSVVVKDLAEAKKLSEFILKEKSQQEFESEFEGKYSKGFTIEKDFVRLGVINQTTMLATETAEIAEFFRGVIKQKFGEEKLSEHFADTRDTLCYATNENQDATIALGKTDADLAIVVGGYNSSNTSHLAELLEPNFPTFFVSGSDEISSKNKIRFFDLNEHQVKTKEQFLPETNKKLKIVLTSGASCPDSVVENVMRKIISFFPNVKTDEEALAELS